MFWLNLDFQNLNAAVDSDQVVNVYGHFLTRLVIVLFQAGASCLQPCAFATVRCGKGSHQCCELVSAQASSPSSNLLHYLLA